MTHVETDPYDPLMSDAEFFKLMEIEYTIETSPKNELEAKKTLPQLHVHQSKNTGLKTWLPIATTTMLIVLIII